MGAVNGLNEAVLIYFILFYFYSLFCRMASSKRTGLCKCMGANGSEGASGWRGQWVGRAHEQMGNGVEEHEPARCSATVVTGTGNGQVGTHRLGGMVHRCGEWTK